MNAYQLAFTLGCAITSLTVNAVQDAVELRIDDDLQQVRVEARDADTGRWLAIASGYRDHADSGWLKVAIPDAYVDAELRVLGSSKQSPLLKHLSSARSAETGFVDYPPSISRAVPEGNVDSTTDGGGETVIEEADIWAWNGSTLYFYNQFRGLQVIDMADPLNPEWKDYFRYPARGEDLYAMEDGTIILIGTGSWWANEAVALQMLSYDGTKLTHEETLSLEAGYYMDSRRYGDYLYVMTREWVTEINPRGDESNNPLIRLHTISLLDGVSERIVDVQTYESNGWMDAVLTAQPDGILLSLNKWETRTTEDFRYRWHSEVHVLVPGDDGIPELVGVAPVSGIIHDKFKMNFRDGLLTTISQKADWTTGRFSRATELENFTLGNNGFVKTGSLGLAPGETLFATRFYGDTVYVVTFLFVDPLFSIDNSNPSKPVIAGELEVPGWSTYIEWVDDQLFAVGIEDSRLTVSIFDVADPVNMSLKDRVTLVEDSWAHSEALYDDQAISFFPDKKLLMLPFTTWSWTSADRIQAMQLISWDDTGLSLRGSIQHLDTPRRGTLTGDTVVTISGREAITTDVSDPDLPVEGGKTTLAWNVSRLIELEDYLIQLETPSMDYGWYWYGYSDSTAQENPVLYVTSKDEPNVLATEVPLKQGRIIGSTLQEDKLVLLQDVSENPNPEYWELPETQDLALRLYDLSNPLDPALLGEVELNSSEYLGGKFDAHIRGDHVIWSSRGSSGNFYIDRFYGDIWPGGYLQNNLVYLVSEYNSASASISFVASDVFVPPGEWGMTSRWHWEDPVLVASLTDYTLHEDPDEKLPDYEAKTRLVAVDFSIPDEPLDLAAPAIPQNLMGVESGEGDAFTFLYFENRYNVLEVWGWDGAIAVPLFEQKISQEDDYSSYSLAWMPPFHLRNRWDYSEEKSVNYLEVWLHDTDNDGFRRINSFTFENDWLGRNAVLEPYYLQSTSQSVHFFRGDTGGQTFEKVQSVNLDLPNIYGLQLEETVISPERAFVPVGMYGVEQLIFDEPLEPAAESSRGFAHLAESNDWQLLDSSEWSQIARSSASGAGALDAYYWLYRPDSMIELDPEASDLGDFARESSWFGTYAHKASDPSWIKHIELGELLVFEDAPSGNGGFHLFYHKFGIVWSRADIYPWMYSYGDEDWIHYLQGSGLDGSRWYWGFKSGWFRGN